MDGLVDRLPHAGSAGLVPMMVAPDQYDAGSGDHDSSDEHAQAQRVVMAGSDSARAVGARTNRHDENGASEKIPERELPEIHRQDARYDRGRHENGGTPPPPVRLFAFGDGLLPPLQGGSRAFHELPPPAAADLVAAESADLAADRGHDEHRHDVEPALAGQHGCETDHGRPDEGDAHVPGRS